MTPFVSERPAGSRARPPGTPLLALAVLSVAGCVGQAQKTPRLFDRLALAVAEQAEALAPGLAVSHVALGDPDAAPEFTLAAGPMPAARAEALLAELGARGFSGHLRPPAASDSDGQSLGVLVQLGSYPSRARAEEAAAYLAELGSSFAVRNVAEDGWPSPGPIRLSVLRLLPAAFGGELAVVLAQDRVQGRETVSRMAKRRQAVAAVNGGFFAWEDRVGEAGDPAGLLVLDGSLISEAVAGRPALLIDSAPSSLNVRIVRDVRTRVALRLGASTALASGVNRVPGKILNCGFEDRAGGAAHDVLCRRDSELIVYDEHYGVLPKTAGAVDILVADNKRVVSCGSSRSIAIRPGFFVIRASGEWLDFARQNCAPGREVTVNVAVTAASGRIDLGPGVFAVGGGPMLLGESLDGIRHYAAEGWDAKERPAFYHDWLVRRHPRTAVGLSANGDVFFVVVYGRQAGYSIGASLADLTRIMHALGAVSAMNLDGGGSSVMIVDGAATGRPSDRAGERPVADAIIVKP